MAESTIFRNLPRSVLFVVLMLGVPSSLLYVGCTGCQSSSGDPRLLVPADAKGVLVVPSLDSWRQGALSFLSGVEGASGFLELLHARTGLDLTSPDGPAQAGVDSKGAVVIFQVGSQTLMGLPVSDPERFNRWLGHQAARLTSSEVQREAHDDGVVGIVAGPGLPNAPDMPQWRLAWGTTSRTTVSPNVGLVVLGGPFSDPVSTWTQVASGPGGGLQSLRGAMHASQALGQANGMWGGWEAPPWMPSSIEAKGAVAIMAPFYPALTTWSLWGEWQEDSLILHANALWPGNKSMQRGWFGRSDGQLQLAEVFPKSLTAWTRLHLNMNRFAKMPKVIKKRIRALSLPEMWRSIIPDLPAALAELNGDFSFAILGLDPSFRIDLLKRHAGSLKELLQMIHCAVAFRVRSIPSFKALLTRARAVFEQRGWTVGEIENGVISGLSFSDPTLSQSWSVIMRQDVVVVLSGKDEVRRFIETSQRTATPLSTVATSEAAKEALTSRSLTLGGFVGFTRVTRELADKGFPPYFLKMIHDVRNISLSAEIHDQGLNLTLEIAL